MIETVQIAGKPYEIIVETQAEIDRIKKYLPREEAVMTAFRDALNEDDVVFDIGANIGTYTLVAADEAFATYAFEPMPSNVRRLHDNLMANQLHAFVTAAAVSDEFGTVSMGTADGVDDEAGVGLNAIHADEVTDDVLEVPAVTGRGLGFPPNILKIDVEGAEGLVLTGFDEFLYEIDIIFVEIHDKADHRTSVHDYGFTVAEVYDLLHTYGFDTTTLHMTDTEQFVKAE